MKLSTANLQSSLPIMALVLATGHAFTASPLAPRTFTNSFATTTHQSGLAIARNHHLQQQQPQALHRRLQAAAVSPETEEEIERLQQMAAKLRSEAAQLEAEQQQAMTQAATKAFEKFDVNQDGQVDLQELKAGLEKTFKLELSVEQQLVLEKVLTRFDTNNDGVLSQEEFVSLDQFKNQFDQVTREEKTMARQVLAEEQAAEQVLALLQSQIELINDKEPSATDKVVSVLPYLFPLLDGLQFARFFVLDNPDSPLALAAGVLYGLYRAIPFGGFLAFFALTVFSGNPTINRLVRFNMQQAIYLDIALVIPGLLFGLASMVAAAGGGGSAAAGVGAILPNLVQLGTDGVFLGLLATLAYTAGSSLLGKEPDKLPFISDAVKRRMPSVEMFMDAQGRFSPRIEQDKKDDDKTDKADKKN